jgi:hypothetical protein
MKIMDKVYCSDCGKEIKEPDWDATECHETGCTNSLCPDCGKEIGFSVLCNKCAK